MTSWTFSREEICFNKSSVFKISLRGGEGGRGGRRDWGTSLRHRVTILNVMLNVMLVFVVCICIYNLNFFLLFPFN